MLLKPLCKIIKQHGHSGRCSQKAPAAFQPGGHGEFVHPAMKRSTTEVGNDGSTKKSTGGSSSQGVTGYERKKCGRGGGIINLNSLFGNLCFTKKWVRWSRVILSNRACSSSVGRETCLGRGVWFL